MAAGWVKLCGVRTIADARAAVEAGADAIGLVFASSRRQVSVGEAQKIVQATRSVLSDILFVGVFVNATPEDINAIAETVGLDLIQLSGDEPVGFEQSLLLPVIRSLRFAPGSTAETVSKVAVQFFQQRKPPFALLVDAHVPGQYGGTGQQTDWTLAALLAARWPVVLAGGLTPDNVHAAITCVRPFGVDTSSGIETNGQKDPEKMRAFVAASRASFALYPSHQRPAAQKEVLS